MKHPLSRLLVSKDFPLAKANAEDQVKKLQLRILRIQQAIWHQKCRAILVFEGFDAAGKGGIIRRITENLDPRGVRVYPVGPPREDEQGRHYLYRFWRRIPDRGTIAIFDRSWYGRVLVERVNQITPPGRLRDAYGEIGEFEKSLVDDGVEIIKFFLAIDKKEQLNRFEQRIHDPYKQWKLTKADIQASQKWDEYVVAADEMLERTNFKFSKWNLVPANDKLFARVSVLRKICDHLSLHERWMENAVKKYQANERKALLRDLNKIRRS